MARGRSAVIRACTDMHTDFQDKKKRPLESDRFNPGPDAFILLPVHAPPPSARSADGS